MLQPSSDILIVGGSPEPSSPELLVALASGACKVLACDAGCGICMQAGVQIDLVVGDFDSVTDEALDYARGCGAEFLTFPADKDETDLELALLYCKDDCRSKRQAGMLDDRSYSVALTCVSGGRLDHMLAVLGSLCHAYELDPVVYEDSYILFTLAAPTRFAFDEIESRYPDVNAFLEDRYIGRTVSLIALGGTALVSETGMKWNLDHVELRLLSDLGVSNIVRKADAAIEVFEGICAFMVLHEFVEALKRHHEL